MARIADLMLEAGRARAAGHAGAGQAWGQGVARLGDILSGSVGNYYAAKEAEKVNQLRDLQMQDAKMGLEDRTREREDRATLGSAQAMATRLDPAQVEEQMAQLGQGHLIPAFRKSYQEAEAAKLGLKSARQQVEAAELDYWGSLAMGVKPFLDGPDKGMGAVQMALQHASELGYDPSKYMAQVTPETIPQLIEALIAKSPKYSQLAAQQRGVEIDEANLALNREGQAADNMARMETIAAQNRGLHIQGQNAAESARHNRAMEGTARLTAAAALAKAGAGDTDATGMRALAEMASRTGQLPEGTPTQRGAVLRAMASDRQLLSQYEQKRMEPIRSQAQTMLAALDDLVTEKGELTPGAKAIFGQLTPTWTRDYGVREGTVAANASLRQVVGQEVISMIKEMKNQSPTGATGFGQLNREELDIMLAAATRLTQRLPEADAKEELSTLRNAFTKIMQPGTGESAALVNMQAPDGRPLQVPIELVEEAKSRGAKVVGQ
jgi:hypothetical protein